MATHITKIYGFIKNHSTGNYDQKRTLRAMHTQAAATQGLFRSPMRAIFQKVPMGPVFCRSSNDGAKERMYVQVQMSSSTTHSRLSKLKSADMVVRQG